MMRVRSAEHACATLSMLSGRRARPRPSDQALELTQRGFLCARNGFLDHQVCL